MNTSRKIAIIVGVFLVSSRLVSYVRPGSFIDDPGHFESSNSLARNGSSGMADR